MGTGIAVLGIWIGSAIAVACGGASEIFVGATIATIFVALCSQK